MIRDESVIDCGLEETNMFIYRLAIIDDTVATVLLLLPPLLLHRYTNNTDVLRK